MGEIASKFGRRLTIACIGMAEEGEDFSTLYQMVDEVGMRVCRRVCVRSRVCVCVNLCACVCVSDEGGDFSTLYHIVDEVGMCACGRMCACVCVCVCVCVFVCLCVCLKRGGASRLSIR